VADKSLSALALCVLLAAGAARCEDYSQRPNVAPKQVENVGIDEKLGDQVPLNTVFRNETGKYVNFSDFVEDGKPVIVTLNYSDCPMLCSVQLEGLVEGLQGLNWTVGKEFRIVTIGINPYEPYQQVALTKQKYVREYGRDEARRGWAFLLGKEETTKKVADALGFRYKFDAETGQYMHTAAIFILTPQGRISKVLYGVKYPPEHLKAALAEAADNKIGSPMEQLILYCFRYDPEKGGYVLQARNAMKVGGFFTMILLFGWIGIHWIRDYRRGRLEKQGKARAGVA
jgi:protein SCO1